MSNLIRIGAIAEGPSDHAIIEELIATRFQPRDIEYVALQPELSLAFTAIESPLGFGWGGIYRWANLMRESGDGRLSGSVLFSQYDAIIIHMDCDVASANYSQIGVHGEIADLPCQVPCPPSIPTIERLESVVLRWLGEAAIPSKVALCVPSQSIEGWILAALYPNDSHSQAASTDCLRNPSGRLQSKPEPRFISGGKKKLAVYRTRAEEFSKNWERILPKSPSAARFDQRLSDLPLPP